MATRPPAHTLPVDISGREGSTVRWLCQSASVAFAQITHERGLTDETVPWFALGDGGSDCSPSRAFGVPMLGAGPSAASAAATQQQIGMKVLRHHRQHEQQRIDSRLLLRRHRWEGQHAHPRGSSVYLSSHELRAAPEASRCPPCHSTVPDGTQVANYEGVVVAPPAPGPEHRSVGHAADLRAPVLGSPGDGLCGPERDYGLNADPTGLTTDATGMPAATAAGRTLTADGSNVFPYLNKVSVDPTQSTWAYQATPLPGANVDTLISGPTGSSLFGIYTSADGRQTMFQTFNENQYYLQSELLRHGELDWLARNTYLRRPAQLPGDGHRRHVHPGRRVGYNDALDRLRRSRRDAHEPGRRGDLRDLGDNTQLPHGSAIQWWRERRLCASRNGGSDPLLSAFQATCSSNCGPANAASGKPYADSFGWISHTYDTPYLDAGCATADYIEAELNDNTSWAAAIPGGTDGGGLGLTDTSDPTLSLGYEDGHVFVPGNHSGFADLVPGNPATVDPPISTTTD